MVDIKKIPDTAVSRDLKDIEKHTQNMYESLVIIAKRAEQISQSQKQELQEKLSEFAPATDNLEEVFENREQIEISTYYEKQPKPTLIAIEEFINDELYFTKAKESEIDSGKSDDEINTMHL